MVGLQSVGRSRQQVTARQNNVCVGTRHVGKNNGGGKVMSVLWVNYGHGAGWQV